MILITVQTMWIVTMLLLELMIAMGRARHFQMFGAFAQIGSADMMSCIIKKMAAADEIADSEFHIKTMSADIDRRITILYKMKFRQIFRELIITQLRPLRPIAALEVR